MNRLILVVVVLVGIWGGANLIVAWTKSATPSAESVTRLAESKPLTGVSETEREARIRMVANQLNRLNFEQRRELRNTSAFETFTDSMTPDEMSRFLDLTLPEGFRQLMVALNAMTPEQRKKIVDRALTDLEENGSRENLRPDDDPNAQKFINEGMTAFYEEASVDVKLDFAPVIEQIQRSLQMRQ